MSSSPLKASILKNTDFIVFRELTGGIYFGEKGLDEKKIVHLTHVDILGKRLREYLT